ncbi:23 kDa integral membrane protein-like isoform X2 [Micropterus salmoides]|uniref:23 kDa integral membrane protein-like isoform X2 n=1 Tax=Micropterus salmoides TaxID=27706 RepID=UPI0018EE2495|nr:23 kDa integral membrane protein-like isoform X2 [Micropterus salmoides]
MPLVNPWLRCLFISFNVFFGICGGLIIIVSLALLSPSLDDLHGGEDVEVQRTSRYTTVVLYIAGSVIMAIAILGAYGAFKKNRVTLTVFLVCTVIGSLLMLQAGVSAAKARPKLASVMEERWRSFLPLDQASDDIKNQAEALQKSLHCCGLFSHEDWNGNIPGSCLCNQEEKELQGKCHSIRYGNFVFNLFWEKKSVFRQLLGSVLSSLMIYQMYNTSDRPNMPLFVPVMFIDQPPAYQQLDNLAE